MSVDSHTPLIEVRGLRKLYQAADGRPVLALQDVTFRINDGEFVALVGPSGCGKSTVLKILGGLLPKSEGDVLFRRQPIEGPRRDVGIAFQDAVLLPWLNVLHNVLLPARVQGLDLKVSGERAYALLGLVGLEEFASKYPHELSGGMQQRAAIARALIHEPALLLMDEPFGALDAMNREYMNLELQRIWMQHRKTVFFITHSIPEAVFLADRVLVMSARPGRIVMEISVDLERPRRLELMGSERFGALTNRIRTLLNAKGGLE